VRQFSQVGLERHAFVKIDLADGIPEKNEVFNAGQVSIRLAGLR
jgi:hypothetical protein